MTVVGAETGRRAVAAAVAGAAAHASDIRNVGGVGRIVRRVVRASTFPRSWATSAVAAKALMAVMLASTPALSTANVSISPIASVIASDRPQVSVIRITSQSTQAQFVEVSVRRIVDPATHDEHEIPVVIDPSQGLGNGLVASPAKFVLAAGATRLVRVVALGRPDAEAAYRVYFSPVTAPDGEPSPSLHSDIEPDVNVSFVWGALVRVEPAKPVSGLARDTDGAGLKNTGNVRVHVLAVGQCTGEDDNTCQWHDIGHSLYPGLTHPIPDALRDAPVRVRYRIDAATHEQVLDLPSRLPPTSPMPPMPPLAP